MPCRVKPPGGWPVVTVHGETWNQQQLLQRNLGGPDDQTKAALWYQTPSITIYNVWTWDVVALTWNQFSAPA